MVAIGRGLASSPKLLMLDEPSMGRAPAIADFIFDRLVEIRRQSKLTILLVEQRVAEAGIDGPRSPRPGSLVPMSIRPLSPRGGACMVRRHFPGERRASMSTRYFFFGTLMDRDVLELVLNRAVAPNALVPARLPGYRRVRIMRDSFPVLVEDQGNVVDGIVFSTASAEEDARILFFEDYDYDLAPCRPTLGDGRTVDATFCGAQPEVIATDEPWDLERWAVRHKRGFLELARVYMGCYGRLTSEEAEPVWVETRERLRAEGVLVRDPQLAPAEG